MKREFKILHTDKGFVHGSNGIDFSFTPNKEESVLYPRDMTEEEIEFVWSALKQNYDVNEIEFITVEREW